MGIFRLRPYNNLVFNPSRSHYCLVSYQHLEHINLLKRSVCNPIDPIVTIL